MVQSKATIPTDSFARRPSPTKMSLNLWRSFLVFGPEGSPCKFSISMDEKGPAAKKVRLLGAAGSQIRQMKWMLGYGYRGFGGFGHYARRECALGYGIQVGQDLHDSMLHISVQIEMP